MEIELHNLKIDEELEKLIPPLTDDEYELLHESIDRDGCLNPLIVWNGYVIDGHNRYHICRLLKKPFEVTHVEFKHKDEAKLWILRHQLGKRNLEPFQKTELALKLKPLIAQQAKVNQQASGGAVPKKIAKPVDTREEVAKIAGVSPAQISKVEKILSEANPEDIERLRSGDASINAVHNGLKIPVNDVKKSLTRKQLEEILRGIDVKVGKIAAAPTDLIEACKNQLDEIMTKLTAITPHIVEGG